LKVKILFIITMFLCWGAYGQQTLITGKVRDKKTGEALIGATVATEDGKNGTVTDYEGAFSLRIASPIPLNLVVQYAGYERKVARVESSAKPLQIMLDEKMAELDAVEIRDTRITQKQKQAPLTIETLDAISIKETPAANFYEGLAHLKGVDITSASIGFKIINTRGFNSTSPVRSLQLIDGVDNQSPGLNFSLGNFLGSSELDIQRVDLVVGASGAYFGPNAFNGVINMQTKSPFTYPGLTVMTKVGERNLYEGGFRWAQKFQGKDGKDRFAYKINMYWMQARDWEAENYDATLQSPVDEKNPGGFDAVNRYGDEYVDRANYTAPDGPSRVGRRYFLRDGYNEIDLVDYNTRNLKSNMSIHYLNKQQVEFIAASAYSNGTTIYQGDNRFSLRDIQFFQHRAEIRKENKFFIRAYVTHEDAGNSYDAYNTALLLQQAAKPDRAWALDYENRFGQIFDAGIRQRWLAENRWWLDTIPAAGGQRLRAFEEYIFNEPRYFDSLVLIHGKAREWANTMPTSNGTGSPRFEPGTERFDSAFNAITSRTNREGGSRFFDRSLLYHIMGEYRYNIATFDWVLGGNFRQYRPYSQGTIFLDTTERITNSEIGTFMGVEKKLFNNKVKTTATLRADKNQNFDWLLSPAGTIVYVQKEHVFRVSASSAIRNPTLADQYINLNVGRATLIGNLQGFDSLVRIPSVIEAFNNGRDKLEYFNVAPVKPERVRTIEFGYRTTIKQKLFIDANYYYSWYRDFIGFQIGADIDWPASDPFTRSLTVYRVTANATSTVTTQGFTIGTNYFWRKYLGFSANYSWNVLNQADNRDSLIPAYNTPEHKYNLGINGRNINSKIGNIRIMEWGYSINYKWQEGFMFEGSPQFTGIVPSYSMVDSQVNKRISRWNTIVKLGASNLLNNQVFQVYGGPRVGRLIYFSLVYEVM
jgi:iron complex outermembrane receptor protein